MNLLHWLAEKLPTGKAAPAIAKCQANLAKAVTHDERALWNMQLWKIYNKLGAEKPLFSMLFRALANYQLDQALLWKENWAEPLALRASQQIQEDDLPNALETLEQYAEIQSKWLERVKTTDSQRLQFCKCFFIGGRLLGQLGRFADAVKWFTRAREELEKLPVHVRVNEGDLQEGIFEGIVGCLILDFRYAEARNLIRQTLQGALFQEYESKTRRRLRALDEVLGELAEATRDFEASKSAAQLRARLTEEIQKCDSAEAARRIRREIVSAVSSTELNREIQELAEAILKILEREREELERHLAASAVDEVGIDELPQDLSKVNPELAQAARELLKQQRETSEGIRNFNLTLARYSLGVNRWSASMIQDSADSTYRVPKRYYLKWWWWGTRRFVVQIVLVSFGLEKIIHSAVEEKGKSLLEILHFKSAEVMIGVIAVLVGFLLGGFVERRIDKWTLGDYKDTLMELVSDRFTVLWTTYNSLMNLYAKTKEIDEPVPATGEGGESE